MTVLRNSALISVLLAPIVPAYADDAPQQVNSTMQALAQMVAQAQERELAVIVQVYDLRSQIIELRSQVEKEKKRADDAEAALKASPTAK